MFPNATPRVCLTGKPLVGQERCDDRVHVRSPSFGCNA
jgi:hypothetical protein